MQQLGAAYRVARMDFIWSTCEQQRGVYDFSLYDALLNASIAANVQPMWILDYGACEIYKQRASALLILYLYPIAQVTQSTLTTPVTDPRHRKPTPPLPPLPWLP